MCFEKTRLMEGSSSDRIIIALNLLQQYYYYNILSALCGVGNYTLKPEYHKYKQDASDINFPINIIKPQSIVEHIRKNKGFYKLKNIIINF